MFNVFLLVLLTFVFSLVLYLYPDPISKTPGTFESFAKYIREHTLMMFIILFIISLGAVFDSIMSMF